jgi:hypothetical protein
MRFLGWIQGALAAVNLGVAGLWLYGLVGAGCDGGPLLAAVATTFIAGFLAAGGMWSVVYRAGR